MAALICGSLAFDTITTFPGRFAEQILPEQLHILNVSFLVPGLRREFGGCAGNIAYNLRRSAASRWCWPRSAATAPTTSSACSSWGVATELVRADRRQPTPPRRSSSPTPTTTRSPPSIPARCSRRTRSTVPAARRSGAGDRRARRPRGDAAARRAARAPPASRSSSIRARACRCSTATSCVASSSRRAGSRSTTTRPRCCASAPGMTLEAMSRSHLRGIVVTLGADGCELWQDGERLRVPGVAADERARSDRLRRRVSRRAALRPGARLVAGALRRARQPPRRAQDRQPRRRRTMCWIARSSRPEPRLPQVDGN